MFIYKIKTSKNELKQVKSLCEEDTDLKSDFFLLTDNLDLFRKIIKTKFNITELLSYLYVDSLYENHINPLDFKNVEKAIFDNIFCNLDYNIDEELPFNIKIVIEDFSIMLGHLIKEKLEDKSTEDHANIVIYEDKHLEDVYQDLLDYEADYKLCFDSSYLLTKLMSFSKPICDNVGKAYAA